MSARIAAIPTVYRGTRYRSRLEARWAAFFDGLGWGHVYEPFDLGEWSPDFMLTGHTSFPQRKRGVLVEVKPITEFDRDVAARMTRAARGKEHSGMRLLLGVAPLWDQGSIGWWFNGEVARFRVWADATGAIPDLGYTFMGTLTPFSEFGAFFGKKDLLHPRPNFEERARGDLLQSYKLPEYAGMLQQAWGEACNAVQWHPAAPLSKPLSATVDVVIQGNSLRMSASDFVSARLRCLTVILLWHPMLWPDVEHSYAGLDLPRPLALLRAALQEWAETVDVLDPQALMTHLTNAGLKAEADQVLSGLLPSSADLVEIAVEWWQIFGSLKPARLGEEIALAEVACAYGTGQDRLLALKEALKRICAGDIG